MHKVTTRIMVNGVMSSDINVMDRGFQYGDGLFETMVIVNGALPLWEKHWQRLKRGCEILSIELPDKSKVEHDISTFIQDIPRSIIKLIVTRGIGGRGYAVSESLEPEVVLIHSAFPNYPEHNWQEGITARLCCTRLSLQPALAGIKHLNRLEQVLARNEWRDAEIVEGIMLDIQGHVIEGTMTNLFIMKNGKVITTDINQCGVAGVMRETVLDLLAQENIPHEIKTVSQNDLGTADEVFLTNSVIGIWPVMKIDDTVYQVGELTKTLQNKINKIINHA